MSEPAPYSRTSNIADPALFTDNVTFMGVPLSRDLSGARAAVLGIPFDCGTHPVRIGARHAPPAIRQQSLELRSHLPPVADYDLLERLGVVDCGDVRVIPSRIEDSFPNIEEAVARIVVAGTRPMTMGGDGSVTLPQLRALARRYPDLAVLHLDAHTDTLWDPPGINAATTFTRAAEERLVDPRHSLHVGTRGTFRAPGVYDYARQLGYGIVSQDELDARGIDDVLAQIHRTLAGRPVYLCCDMDFFDPSCAPGVCDPTWGGVTAREGLRLLRGLAGLDFVAFDVNTISPPHDLNGMSALLAATVMLHCLYLACEVPGPGL